MKAISQNNILRSFILNCYSIVKLLQKGLKVKTYNFMDINLNTVKLSPLQKQIPSNTKLLSFFGVTEIYVK